jgi:hypothetical protein
MLLLGTGMKKEHRESNSSSVQARLHFLIAATLVCSGASSVVAQSTLTVDTTIGKLDFDHGVPIKETVTKLYDEMDFQRACQLYLWSFPIVAFANLEVNLEGTTGALPGDLTIYLGNEQSVFFTPNATTPYIVSYLDLARPGSHDGDAVL